jgi:hypothetical protein
MRIVEIIKIPVCCSNKSDQSKNVLPPYSESFWFIGENLIMERLNELDYCLLGFARLLFTSTTLMPNAWRYTIREVYDNHPAVELLVPDLTRGFPNDVWRIQLPIGPFNLNGIP